MLPLKRLSRFGLFTGIISSLLIIILITVFSAFNTKDSNAGPVKPGHHPDVAWCQLDCDNGAFDDFDQHFVACQSLLNNYYEFFAVSTPGCAPPVSTDFDTVNFKNATMSDATTNTDLKTTVIKSMDSDDLAAIADMTVALVRNDDPSTIPLEKNRYLDSRLISTDNDSLFALSIDEGAYLSGHVATGMVKELGAKATLTNTAVPIGGVPTDRIKGYLSEKADGGGGFTYELTMGGDTKTVVSAVEKDPFNPPEGVIGYVVADETAPACDPGGGGCVDISIPCCFGDGLNCTFPSGGRACLTGP